MRFMASAYVQKLSRRPGSTSFCLEEDGVLRIGSVLPLRIHLQIQKRIARKAAAGSPRAFVRLLPAPGHWPKTQETRLLLHSSALPVLLGAWLQRSRAPLRGRLRQDALKDQVQPMPSGQNPGPSSSPRRSRLRAAALASNMDTGKNCLGLKASPPLRNAPHGSSFWNDSGKTPLFALTPNFCSSPIPFFDPEPTLLS